MRKVVLVLILGLVLGCPAQATDAVLSRRRTDYLNDVPDPSVIRVGIIT